MIFFFILCVIIIFFSMSRHSIFNSSKMLSPIFSSAKKEEAAITLQINNYKQYYLNKIIQPHNSHNYIREVQQLKTLLVSFCKNISQIAPEAILAKVQEMGSIMDDLIHKYQVNTEKLNDKALFSNQETQKAALQSDLCSICSQPIQKAEIERARMHIMQEIKFNKECFTEEEGKDEEEDRQFFLEMQKMLTNKQSEVDQHQKRISNYQNIVMNSLNSLISIQKDLFEKQKIPLPNLGWVREAQNQMQILLKDSFGGKIPPFILKMFKIFQQIQLKTHLSRQKAVETQTESQTQAQVLELKKKNLQSSRKLGEFQTKSRTQQKQIAAILLQNQHLETKATYFKRQINELIEEIDRLKSENQKVEKQLHYFKLRAKSSTISEMDDEINRKTEGAEETSKTIKSDARRMEKGEKEYPQIKVLNEVNQTKQNRLRDNRKTSKNSLISQSSRLSRMTQSRISRNSSLNRNSRVQQRVSINLNSNTERYQQHASKKSNLSNNSKSDNSSLRGTNFQVNRQFSHISRNSQLENMDQIRVSQGCSQRSNRSNKTCRMKRQQSDKLPENHILLTGNHSPTLTHDSKRFNSKHTIPQVEAESNYQLQTASQAQVKGQNIKEQLKEQLKDIIKQALPQRKNLPFQKNTKNRSSQPLPQLKRIAHKLSSPQDEEQESIVEADLQKKNMRNSTNRHLKWSNKMTDIYNELKNKGQLCKISEEQFKFIMKVKAFDFGFPAVIQAKRRREEENALGQIQNSKQQYLNQTRREWNQTHFHPEYSKTVQPSFYSPAKQTFDCSMLFTSQTNAFNYETSLTKNHIRGVYSMTKAEHSLCEQLFQRMNDLKSEDSAKYNYICSYLRYPFQMMQNSVAMMQISSLTYQNFEYYFERIVSIHTQCKKNNGLCRHICQFRDKLMKGASQISPTF